MNDNITGHRWLPDSYEAIFQYALDRKRGRRRPVTPWRDDPVGDDLPGLVICREVEFLAPQPI